MEQPPQKLRRRKADWSNLPPNAIVRIAVKLKFYGGDHRSFRSVCKKWRNSTFPFPQFLSLKFPREIPSKLGNPNPNFLISNAVHILYPNSQIHDSQRFKPWIVSIEEFRKLKICNPFTNDLIGAINLPKSLNLLDFGRRIVDFGVNLRFSDCVEDVFASKNCRLHYWKNYPAKMKCILVNGVVVVLLLYLRGALGTVEVDKEWKFKEFCPDCLFDDIVEYKGQLCAISNAGLTLLINDFDRTACPGSFSRKLSSFPYKTYHQSIREFALRRKRLVVHNGVLYLIVKGYGKFQVFKLNDELNEWERVYSFGDKILIVTFDKCVFIDVCHLGGLSGDYILFPKDCFPDRVGKCSDEDELFRRARKHLEIGVFDMDNNTCRLISSYPQFAELFWPPPSWLWLNSCSSNRYSEEEEKSGSYCQIGSDSSSVERSESAFLGGKNGQSCHDHRPSSIKKDTFPKDVPSEDNNASDPANKSPHWTSKSDTAEKNVQRNDVSLTSVQRIPSRKQVDVVSSPHVESSTKMALTKFQGVDVSFNLVPVLEKVWDKYGNIIEGHTVHSDVLLTWALESLANMIIILQKRTGDSVNDSDAEYLNSTIADLQMMHFKLDWLNPFVERALAAHKSKHQKGIMKDLETRKSKLLAELRVLEEQMVQQEKLVADSLKISAPSVMKKSLAEGLL